MSGHSLPPPQVQGGARGWTRSWNLLPCLIIYRVWTLNGNDHIILRPSSFYIMSKSWVRQTALIERTAVLGSDMIFPGSSVFLISSVCHPPSHSSGRLLMGCKLEYNISWTCFVLCLGNCIRARVGFSGFGQQNCVVFKHRISLPSLNEMRCACWLHKKVDWRKRKCRTGKMKKKKSKWNEARAENQRVAIYRARLGKPNKSRAK